MKLDSGTGKGLPGPGVKKTGLRRAPSLGRSRPPGAGGTGSLSDQPCTFLSADC